MLENVPIAARGEQSQQGGILAPVLRIVSTGQSPDAAPEKSNV
jgi:hypothetical protein